jgi:UDP-glucose 4-epimerase
MKQNKIIIFGGSGFLGSHVADKLSDNGYSVFIFDKKISKYLRPNQEMILGDILDEDLILNILKDFDYVYNFAALADLNHAINQPVETIKINILGNSIILESARKNKIKRFIYASTVYVNSREGSFYRCSKQASESYIEEYNRLYNLDYTILRYGSLYGPRSDETNGLFRIVKKAIQTGIVKYEGSPESLREYIHVEDAAIASVRALNDEFKNQSVVLTGQEPMRVLDMLKMLSEILDLKENVQFIENEQIGHYIRTPYAYQNKIGRKYIPPFHVDLGQGLLQLIEEVKKDLQN